MDFHLTHPVLTPSTLSLLGGTTPPRPSTTLSPSEVDLNDTVSRSPVVPTRIRKFGLQRGVGLGEWTPPAVSVLGLVGALDPKQPPDPRVRTHTTLLTPRDRPTSNFQTPSSSRVG